MKTLSIKTLALVSAIAMAGCSSNETKPGVSLTPEELEARNNALLARETAVAKKEAELADKLQATGASNASPKTASSASFQSSSANLLPPSANAGECYARVWVEPQYEMISKEVLLKEESSRMDIKPAVYETVTEQLLVKPATTRLDSIPATYETITEQKLVQKGGQFWHISKDLNSAPASQHMLDTAAAHGIDLESAQPGDCFHEHFVPAKIETVDEQVLVKEAYDVVEVTEPEYRWVEKEILVSEASTRIEEVPAVYKTVEEQVVDVAAHTIWKKGSGPIQKIDEATGEIMCLVEVPATYKTVSKQVLVSPATTRVVEVPAVYETVKVKELAQEASEVRNTIPAAYKTVSVTRQVAEPSLVWHEVHNKSMTSASRTGNQICLVERPERYETVTTTRVVEAARTVEKEVPAEYKTVEVQKLVSAAKTEEIKIPAEYQTVTLKQEVEAGYMEWRSILCETNMDTGTISQIQTALDARGYNPGKIDGVVGRNTMRAVNAFQKDNELPVDKFLNIETVRALGVSI